MKKTSSQKSIQVDVSGSLRPFCRVFDFQKNKTSFFVSGTAQQIFKKLFSDRGQIIKVTGFKFRSEKMIKKIFFFILTPAKRVKYLSMHG
jgi:hypothetical protein